MLFVFSKLKAKKWKKLSPEKRFLVLEAIEKKIARWLEIDPIDIKIKEDSRNWNCLGVYTSFGGEKMIMINESLIYEPRLRFHALETIAHETRHAYQNWVTSRDLHWYEFRAKRWKQNWSGYFSSTTDSVMYNNQSVERDAQKYSIKILKKFRGKFGGEQDYQNTLEAVEWRYNQAELDARKKYGFFYKHKIEKNVKDNAKF